MNKTYTIGTNIYRPYIPLQVTPFERPKILKIKEWVKSKKDMVTYTAKLIEVWNQDLRNSIEQHLQENKLKKNE